MSVAKILTGSLRLGSP